jgi:hypothetical protein
MNDESPPMLVSDANGKCVIQFWEDAKANGLHPGQFNRLLMVRISVPGDNKSSSEQWVEEEYPKDYPHPIFKAYRKNEEIFARFGKQIEAYKANNRVMLEAGTPLEAWPMVNRAQVAMLKHNGIHSVEALPDLPDEIVSRLGIDGRALVQKAKDYLKNSVTASETAKAAEEKRLLETRFADLEAKYLDLAEALADLPDEARTQVKEKLKKGKQKDAA